MRSTDRTIGIGTIGLSAVCLWELDRTPARRFGMEVLSSTAFPTLTAWVLLFLGVVLVLSTIRPFRLSGAAPTDSSGSVVVASTPDRRSTLKAPALLLSGTIMYVLVISTIGFYPASALYLSLAIYFGAPVPRRILPPLVISLLAMGVVYLVFHLWLSYYLPRGSIW